MNDLLPKAVAPYAKAWIAFLGFVLTTVGVAWSAAPEWVPIVASVLTAVGVYLTPNADKPTPDGY